MSVVGAGPREWAGLAVLALPLLVLALDVSILYLALPELASALGAGPAEQLWILDVYGFFIAGFLLTAGTVGDRIGRRRLLLLGSAAFAALSVAAAWAPNALTLVVVRALLGVAGATLMPSTLALIATMFPDPAQRTRAIAVWMTTFAGGAAAGPVVGGLLLEHIWWGSVFLLGVPFLVALLVLGPRLLPADDPAAGRGRLDLPSVGLSLATMLPLVHALKESLLRGPGVAAVLATALGLTAGTAFVLRQRRLADPLLDLGLFRSRAFVAAVGVLFLALVAMNGMNVLLPQLLVVVAGLGPAAAGIALVPLAAVTVLGSLATPALAARFGRGRVLVGGPAVSAVGAVLVGALVGPGTPVPVVVALVAVVVAGVVPLGVLGTDLVVGAAPPDRAGGAAAVSETAGELGVALGVAVIGSVATSVYAARVFATAAPSLPGDAVARVAESAFGAPDATAELLPGQAAALRDTSAAAFADAFAVVGWVGAGLAVVLVVLAATALRHVR